MIGKRIVDLLISGIVLLLMAPLMLVITIVIAIRMGRPIMFRQSRPGYKGQDINVLKFRTMTDCRGADGKLLPDCMRETSIGKFLRVTSLDELPQFISVFLGNMSVVGPRPLMHMFVDNCTPVQKRRFEVRPGITGMAQIHGRKSLDYDKRFALDVWYVDNRSMWLDFKIMLITARVLFQREGLIETGHMIDGGIAAFMDECGLNGELMGETPSSIAISTGLLDENAQPARVSENARLVGV
jgi:sugar transferase EpsL